MSRPPHVYLSTACMHEEHDKCRQSCKFCDEKCVCPCHPWVSPGSDASRRSPFREPKMEGYTSV